MAKKSKQQALVNAGQTVSEAFEAILKHNFTDLAQWEGAARSWNDTEGVHQMRVALRRMRSVVRTFRPAVPRSATDRWVEEMRWIASQLGPARDLDVFIAEGLDTAADKLSLPGQKKLTTLIRRRRQKLYNNVQAMLDSDRYASFKQELGAWLDAKSWLSAEELQEKNRRWLESKLVPFARQRLDKQGRKVLETGNNVNQDSPQALHRLRIECKKLRYPTEFFSPLFKGMDDFIDHLKGLQDLLGVIHDVAVMPHLLDELLARTKDPQVLQYAGGLVGWRTRQYHEIKASFDERWKDFAGARHPWGEKSAVVH